MCDYGRSTHERYKETAAADHAARAHRGGNGTGSTAAWLAWKDALDAVHRRLRGALEGASRVPRLGLPDHRGGLPARQAGGRVRLAAPLGADRRRPGVDDPPLRAAADHGREQAPNRRGAELAGLAAGDGERSTREDLLQGDGAARCAVLIVCDSDFGQAAPTRPRRSSGCARRSSWSSSAGPTRRWPQAADIALPVAHHGEKDGTFVNVEWRVQRFERAFPPPGQTRAAVEALGDLLSRFDAAWANQSPGKVFDRLAGELPAFAGSELARPAGHRRGAPCPRSGASPSGPGRRGGYRRPPHERRDRRFRRHPRQVRR